MRNFMKLTAVLLFMITVSIGAQAQKFGHVDLQGLVQVMPEWTVAQTDFNTFQAELEDMLGEMQNDYQALLVEFEALGEAASEIKKNAKIEEIQGLQQRIQSYQGTAQQQLQTKNGELMKPVYDKAQSAIAEVAKEKGLIYVFETNSLLYKSNESIDLLPLVKTKLGIQ